MNFDHAYFRAHFSSLNANNIYLDSASTALKPAFMAKAIYDYYSMNTATVLRSKHKKSALVTDQTDEARELVANYLGAEKDEIIWTKGATEAINLITQSFAENRLNKDDEIIVSNYEHHSNLIPWLSVSKKINAKVIEWTINDKNQLCETDLIKLITPKTKVIAVTQMSNVTGYKPNIKKIAHIAHQHNAVIVVDGAQGAAHLPLNVKDADVDFYAFSAHKMYGPTGLGALYAKKSLLEMMPCWQTGGKMLKDTSFGDFTPAEPPYKFEAGTPNISAIIGFAQIIKWLNKIDLIEANNYSAKLAKYLHSQLSNIDGITIYSEKQSPIISFSHREIHHQDFGLLLAEQNIAVRTGELCAKPLIQKIAPKGVIRVSIMPYNNQDDIKQLITAIINVIDIFK